MSNYFSSNDHLKVSLTGAEYIRLLERALRGMQEKERKEKAEFAKAVREYPRRLSKYYSAKAKAASKLTSKEFVEDCCTDWECHPSIPEKPAKPKAPNSYTIQNHQSRENSLRTLIAAVKMERNRKKVFPVKLFEIRRYIEASKGLEES